MENERVALAASSSSEALGMGGILARLELDGHRRHSQTSASNHSVDAPAGVSLKEIFILCVVLYGAIAMGWVFLWYLRRHSSPRAAALLDLYRLALLCASWCSMSVGMHVLNKSVVSSLQAPALVSSVQMAMAVVIVGSTSIGQLFRADRRQLGYWMIVPLFFSAMLCTSCYTYQYISLSLITVMRNLTPLVVLPIECALMPRDKRPRITGMVLLALLVMIAGTLVYAGGVQHISWIGVAFAVSNMVLAACDRLIQRFLLTGPCKDLQSSVCTVVNNSIGIIPSMILGFVTHQVADAQRPEHAHLWTEPRVLSLLVLSGIVGIGICYLGFECQREITATSFFVLQNLSKVAVVCAGIFFFKDPIQSPTSGVGLLLSLGGSFLYGRMQMAPQPEAKPLLEKPEKKQAENA